MVDNLFGTTPNRLGSLNSAFVSQIVDSNFQCVLFELHQDKYGNFKFLFISKFSGSLLGFTCDQILESPDNFFENLEKEEKKELVKNLQISSINQKNINWEGKYRNPLWRRSKWLNLRASFIFQDNLGSVWSGFMTNISHSKRFQNYLSSVKRLNKKNDLELKKIADKKDLKNLIFLKRVCNILSATSNTLIEGAAGQDYLPMVVNSLSSANSLIENVLLNLTPSILSEGLPFAISVLSSEMEFKNGYSFNLHCFQNDLDVDLITSKVLYDIARIFFDLISDDPATTAVEISLYGTGNDVYLEIVQSVSEIKSNLNTPKYASYIRFSKETIDLIDGSLHLAIQGERGAFIRICAPVR